MNFFFFKVKSFFGLKISEFFLLYQDFFLEFSSSRIFEAVSYCSSSNAVCNIPFNSSVDLDEYSVSVPVNDEISTCSSVLSVLSPKAGLADVSSSNTMPAEERINSYVYIG